MQENRNIKETNKFKLLFVFDDYVVIAFFIYIAYFNLRTWITFDLKNISIFFI